MHSITIQLATEKKLIPSSFLLRKWARSALDERVKSTHVTIRIVAENEMKILNEKWRGKRGVTNILSFPFHLPDLLGDMVICAQVVNREAIEQGKEQNAHWAHMVIHGICHLLGYDHETDEDAVIMETLEIDIMKTLGFANPYASGVDIHE